MISIRDSILNSMTELSFSSTMETGGRKVHGKRILVTQALDERDLLVKKIDDKLEKASFTETKKHNEENVTERRIPQKDFDKEAQSSYPQILDLMV